MAELEQARQLCWPGVSCEELQTRFKLWGCSASHCHWSDPWMTAQLDVAVSTFNADKIQQELRSYFMTQACSRPERLSVVDRAGGEGNLLVSVFSCAIEAGIIS